MFTVRVDIVPIFKRQEMLKINLYRNYIFITSTLSNVLWQKGPLLSQLRNKFYNKNLPKISPHEIHHLRTHISLTLQKTLPSTITVLLVSINA